LTMLTQLNNEAVGPRKIVRFARSWAGSGVRAAALVRRTDVVVDGTAGLLAGKELRDARRLMTLPPDMLLVLRDRDVLLLVATQRWLLAAPATLLSRWSLDAVDIAVRSGYGPFRPVRITDGDSTLTVAAPWWRPGQRRALSLIERAVG
jgi:hypothetical protein